MKMNVERTYNQVTDRINELVKICERKKWSITQKPIIKRPASDRLIKRIENKIAQPIPEDLKKLFRFSRHVEFRYQFDETLSEEFNQNFSGEIYWNLKELPLQVLEFKGWVEAFLDPEFNDPETIRKSKSKSDWKNILPLISVPNGDVITKEILCMKKN